MFHLLQNIYLIPPRLERCHFAQNSFLAHSKKLNDHHTRNLSGSVKNMRSKAFLVQPDVCSTFGLALTRNLLEQRLANSFALAASFNSPPSLPSSAKASTLRTPVLSCQADAAAVGRHLRQRHPPPWVPRIRIKLQAQHPGEGRAQTADRRCQATMLTERASQVASHCNKRETY